MGGDHVLTKLTPGRLELHNAARRTFGRKVAKRLNATGWMLDTLQLAISMLRDKVKPAAWRQHEREEARKDPGIHRGRQKDWC